MATTYKIHPAIGIARVGNSPDEFFIGPERVGEYPEPPGGFKDAECRVKRQAARFRIFAHHDDGTTEEITDAEAEIGWTVHVANKKATHGPSGGEPAIDLTIDPGARTLNSPNDRAEFDGGTITFAGAGTVEVGLGEMRTDDDGRLLVLGGLGEADSPTGEPLSIYLFSRGWYDDIADGSVSASITLRSSGEPKEVTGSWIIVGPPKFAPHQDSVTTLYDVLLVKMVDLMLLSEPDTTSYTADVAPILQRARDMAWVEGRRTNHLWTQPVTDQVAVDDIFGEVGIPGGGGGDMPDLMSSSDLTTIQYAHLQRWQAGTYINDWTTSPGPSGLDPDGIDRAALDGCVGASLAPGFEVGGESVKPIFEALYTKPFRIDHGSLKPGGITRMMPRPWHTDFQACQDRWWPVPHPNLVIDSPSREMPLAWDRGIGSLDDMVAGWADLGFVVRQGAEHLEVDRCDTASINLLTPTVNFVDVPQGPLGGVREALLPIEFEVIAPSGPVTLEYAPGGAPSHPQLVALNRSDAEGPTTGRVATIRLWLVYRTGAVRSAIPTQTLTVWERTSGRMWEIEIDGNTVTRLTTGVAFALDRSGSMRQDRGDGRTKHDSLQEAANLFLDMMLPGDGAGIVPFNQDADPLTPVVELGDGMLTDTNRQLVRDAINGSGLNPDGNTSIGDGIAQARAALSDAETEYGQDAIVVLTDGIENRPRWIADVAVEIDATTYAVGFGRPQDISVAALQTIAGNTGGYLNVTGPIIGDNRFRLQKHFLQILAAVNNAEVVLDPQGQLAEGQVISVPFQVTDADTGIEVVLLTPAPGEVDFRLKTPLGQLIEPWEASATPTMHYAQSDGAAFYRLALPVQAPRDRLDQVGTWEVLLRSGSPRRQADEPDHEILHRPCAPESATEQEIRRPSLPYSVVVHAYSNVALEASVGQERYAPGSTINLRAAVTQSGLPIDGVTVWAEITGPGGNKHQVELKPEPSGGLCGGFVASLAGVHEIRLRANGQTRAGIHFTRERLLTAQVWHGADRAGDRASEPGPPVGADQADDHRSCDLIWCLAGPDGALSDILAERLAEHGVDIERIWACLKDCRHGRRR